MSETSGADAARTWVFLRSPVGKLVLLAICIYVLLVATPLVPLPPEYGAIAVWVGSLLATLLLAALSVMLLINGARLHLSVAYEVGLMAISVGLWLSLTRIAGLSHLLELLIAPVATVVFLLTCLWLGRIISRLFRTSSILLPACGAVALADIYTVYAGPTGMMLQINPEFVQSSVRQSALRGWPDWQYPTSLAWATSYSWQRCSAQLPGSDSTWCALPGWC